MLVLTFTLIEHIDFQSTTQPFCGGKKKINVKISQIRLTANLYHREIMPKYGLLRVRRPLFQRDFCCTHLS